MMVKALALYLSAHGITCETKYKTVIAPQNGLFFTVNDSESPLAVSKCFDDGNQYLTENPDGKALYITESKCKINPNWSIAMQKKKMFEKLGGKICKVPQDDINKLYALANLEFEICNKPIVDDNGTALTMDDLYAFIEVTDLLESFISRELIKATKLTFTQGGV
jgi:hypothetical protein